MSFKDITTIGCGGKIKHVYLPKNISSLQNVYKYINKNNLKHTIISNGSNVLASDKFYDGIVILLKNIESSYQIYDNTLICSAFYSSSRLANELAKLKIGNLSFLCGIPGLIGGAIKQNCGAYNDEIRNHLLEVKYINTKGEIVTILNKDLMLSYRYSIFHEIDGIIIEGTFKIEKDVETSSIIKERMFQRNNTQPVGTKNMGSIFKNPSTYKAWEVIDKLNMRGTKKNGATISNKHANFIINEDNSTSEDIFDLINEVKKRSIEELGIKMDCEISIIE